MGTFFSNLGQSLADAEVNRMEQQSPLTRTLMGSLIGRYKRGGPTSGLQTAPLQTDAQMNEQLGQTPSGIGSTVDPPPNMGAAQARYQSYLQSRQTAAPGANVAPPLGATPQDPDAGASAASNAVLATQAPNLRPQATQNNLTYNPVTNTYNSSTTNNSGGSASAPASNPPIANPFPSSSGTGAGSTPPQYGTGVNITYPGGGTDPASDPNSSQTPGSSSSTEAAGDPFANNPGTPPELPVVNDYGGGGGGNQDYMDASSLDMAGGQIVTRPTYARLGESGPEAVVPLHPTPSAKLSPDLLEGHLSPPRVPGVKYSRYKSFNRFGRGSGA